MAFDAALDHVTTAPPAKPAKLQPDISGDIAQLKAKYRALGNMKLDITKLREKMGLSDPNAQALLLAKYGEAEQVDSAQFQNNLTVVARDLAEPTPGLANLLQQSGVGPDTKLVLDFGLILTIGCPGIHLSSLVSFWSAGQPPTPASEPNEVAFMLWQ